ncbi:hypothetical protein VN97_g2636 [Penicillium thymicola]|uniref:Uncharacterized protein n=1 Tax=Penicillium thymicola TaxID=293382 RepID=A0AAI9XB50_PENTH|nr:hypothetical protein VN97_g2636 [Penicillium thymicola]
MLYSYNKLTCLYCLGLTMGPKVGPKTQPICGLGWVGLWTLWAIERSTYSWTPPFFISFFFVLLFEFDW